MKLKRFLGDAAPLPFKVAFKLPGSPVGLFDRLHAVCNWCAASVAGAWAIEPILDSGVVRDVYEMPFTAQFERKEDAALFTVFWG